MEITPGLGCEVRPQQPNCRDSLNFDWILTFLPDQVFSLNIASDIFYTWDLVLILWVGYENFFSGNECTQERYFWHMTNASCPFEPTLWLDRSNPTPSYSLPTARFTHRAWVYDSGGIHWRYVRTSGSCDATSWHTCAMRPRTAIIHVLEARQTRMHQIEKASKSLKGDTKKED